MPASSTYFALHDAHVDLFDCVEAEQAYFEDYDTWASENPDALPSEYPVILVGCGEVWHGRTLVTEPVAAVF